MDRTYFVYILASERNGTLYIGVTNDIIRRVWEHREGITGGFTKTYSVHRLVWFETHEDINNAIKHEKQIKRWRRTWKLRLIESKNSGWNDLYEQMMAENKENCRPERVFERARAALGK